MTVTRARQHMAVLQFQTTYNHNIDKTLTMNNKHMLRRMFKVTRYLLRVTVNTRRVAQSVQCTYLRTDQFTCSLGTGDYIATCCLKHWNHYKFNAAVQFPPTSADRMRRGI